MSSSNPRESGPQVMRWVRGLLPPAEGGQPPALVAARAQLSGWVVGLIAVVVGAAAGFFLVVIVMALPNVPAYLVGFVGGLLVGSAVALVLASRYPIVRRVGAFAILLSPLLLLATPFLLIAAAYALLRRTATPPAAPLADPVEVEAGAVVVKPRRKPRRKARKSP